MRGEKCDWKWKDIGYKKKDRISDVGTFNGTKESEESMRERNERNKNIGIFCNANIFNKKDTQK